MLTPQEYSKKIIVVDDEGIVFKSLKYILKDFDVEYFSDTELAYEYITENFDKIGACFFDLMMPTITGSELANKVREFKSDKKLKIFIFSAASMNLLKEANENKNVDSVVDKPLSANKIKELLLAENFIERSEVRIEQTDEQINKLQKQAAYYDSKVVSNIDGK